MINIMGLDIYLYKNADLAESKRKCQEYEERTEQNWADAGEYDSLTDEQKDSIRERNKEIALELGLNEDGSDPNDIRVEQDSKAGGSEHYFKMGYFRSSYNASGIQRILRNMGLNDLNWVFDNPDGEYEFKPNWEQAFDRINDLISDFSKTGPYRVDAVSGNMFKEPDVLNDAQALQVFLEEKAREHASQHNYSSSRGEFYLAEPLKVLAMIPGTQSILGTRPCVYVITESDNSWYITALQIVRETIEFVLSQDDKEQYYLHWSG
jgi:hypothetical protein